MILREVEEVFRRVGWRIQFVTLRDSAGREHTLQTTAEHPAYVMGQGWTACGRLQPGDQIQEAGGGVSTVTVVRSERHPEGVGVYNFRVREVHTYFVRAENSDAEPVWVHNSYGSAELKANLRQSQRLTKAQVRGMDAAHLVPQSSSWSRFTAALNDKIGQMQAILEDVGIEINDAENGFLTRSTTHNGTHTPGFLSDLHEALVRGQGDYNRVLNVLEEMEIRARSGQY